MSVDLSSVSDLIEQPVIVAALAAVVVLLTLAVAFARKRRTKNRRVAAWQQAADELGISLAPKACKLGPIVSGTVNNHLVTIKPVAGRRGKRHPATLYRVEYTGAEAPVFQLAKRRAGSGAVVDTGHRAFDNAVAVRTEDATVLAGFVTAPRRKVVMRLLEQWPTVEISNQHAQVKTAGFETDLETFVDAVCHLVALAETFDRATVVVDVEPVTLVEVPAPSASAITSVAPRAQPQRPAGDVLVDVRLDEQSVIRELFDAGLVGDEISERFHQFYRGHEVTWAGEIVRISAVESSGERRVAALIGSADGQDPRSGRVVAVTTVGAEPALAQGDVVTFTGALINLDADQRLFHLA